VENELHWGEEKQMQNFKRRYNELDLINSEVYAEDEELASFARRIADTTWTPGEMSRGDWKQLHLNGRRGSEMVERVQAEYDRRTNEIAARERLHAAALALNGERIAGYEIAYPVEDGIAVKGPFHEKIHARLKREGFYAGSKNQVCTWLLPVEKGEFVRKYIEGTLERESKKAAKAAAEKTQESERLAEAGKGAPTLRGKFGDVSVETFKEFAVVYRVKLPYAANGNFESLKSAIKRIGSYEKSGSYWTVEGHHHVALQRILEDAKNMPIISEAKRKPNMSSARVETDELVKAISYDYGNMHNAPRGRIFLHSDGNHYVQLSRRTETDYDGEERLVIQARPATPEESAELRATEARELEKFQSFRRLEKIHDEITTLKFVGAEIPDAAAVPQGDEICVGGGPLDGVRRNKLVVNDNFVWALTWNGESGDDWERNNAGSYIAARVPATEELRREIKDVASKLEERRG
jgi:hypothetical protein